MGIDAWINIGVQTTFKLTFDNLPIIKKLIDNKIDFYVHPFYADYDTNVTDMESFESNMQNKNPTFDIQTLLSSSNNEDFENNLKSWKLKEPFIHFFILILDIYERSVFQMKLPCIFGECSKKIDELMKNIRNAKKKFIKLGIPTEKIVIGYEFRED